MSEQGFLFPEVKDSHIKLAVERVKDALRFSEHLGLGKLYVAFSGGKDSVSLYGVCKLASEELDRDLFDMCEFHYNVTTVDPPELIRFIREHFPFVHRDRPKKTMWQMIVTEGMPPTRLVRYCCRELKEGGGDGRFCLTGVRRAESVKRSKRAVFETQDKDMSKRIMMNDNEDFRQELEHCIPRQKYVVNPLIDWTDEQVWDFIRTQNLPYCSLYDEGWKRIGCIGCPMASLKMREMSFERYPKYREAYVRAFQKMIDNRKARGTAVSWDTGEECYQWWVYGEQSRKAGQEETLF